MNKFLFILDSDFLLTATMETLQLADITIEQVKPEKAPEKFHLCKIAASKMLRAEAITRDELQGLLDSIGGFYCATDLYCNKYGGEPGQMGHAEELLRFANRLQELVRPMWSLEVIKGGKS